MEATPANLQAVASQLQQTINPNPAVRTPATNALRQTEQRQGFPQLLLKLLMSEESPTDVQQASAIYFKNFIKRNWLYDAATDDANRIHPDDRAVIKQYIVDLMVTTTTTSVQKQLSEAVTLISASDFPGHWQDLLPALMARLNTTDDFEAIIGILETLTAIFARYCYEAKGQKLWEEIQYVLSIVPRPLLCLFQKACTAQQNPGNPIKVQKQLIRVLILLSQTFRCLNTQDIPEFYENHMSDYMGPFLVFLQYTDRPHLDPSADGVPGLLDELQASVMENVKLYTNKYEEEFQEWSGKFVKVTWHLLTRLDDRERFDPLVASSVRFLTSVVTKEHNKALFSNEAEASLKTICHQVIIPQLKLRESDVEQFTMNGLEFIRRDIEGSDTDTRRRTTVEFVRGLCKYFEPQVTAILKEYVGVLLQQYAADPKQNWVAKDAAIYVVLALSVKGSTAARGATQLNPFIDVMSFFSEQIAPELQKPDIGDVPVLKAACLKFVATFRIHLPVQALTALMPLLIRYLASSEFVLHTYAANCIERLLSVSDKDTTPEMAGPARFTKQALQPYNEALMKGLFGVLQMEESRENEYVMKCVMRVASVAKDDITALVGPTIEQLKKTLMHVAQNPRNPRFNHHLFEAIACLVTNVAGTHPNTIGDFEAALFPTLGTLLNMKQCEEFGHYVFQIFSQLLEIRQDVPDSYVALFSNILAPAMWDNHGNVPALVRLMRIYVSKNAQLVWSKITGVLGVFQKLLSSKRLDHHGMELLSILFEYLPLQQLQQYLGDVYTVLFKALQSRNSTKYTNSLIVWLSLFVCKHGLESLHASLEAYQPGIFHMIFVKVWLPNVLNITDNVQRKTCNVAMTRMLCGTDTLICKIEYSSRMMWQQLLAVHVSMLEGQEGQEGAGAGAGVETDVMELSSAGFSTAFCRLAFAMAKKHDPNPDVLDAKVYLVQQLGELSQKLPLPGSGGGVGEAEQQCLQTYLLQSAECRTDGTQRAVI